ncbi:MAG: hypothetical protein ACOYJV_01595 [Aminivibrio sp.]|jgi:hypothetical protein
MAAWVRRRHRWIQVVAVTAVLAVQIPATLPEGFRLGWERYGREVARGVRGAYR